MEENQKDKTNIGRTDEGITKLSTYLFPTMI